MSTNGYIVISLKRLKVTTHSDGQTKFRRRISVALPCCTVIGESKPNRKGGVAHTNRKGNAHTPIRGRPY